MEPAAAAALRNRRSAESYDILSIICARIIVQVLTTVAGPHPACRSDDCEAAVAEGTNVRRKPYCSGQMVLAVRAKGLAADMRSAGMRGGIPSGKMKYMGGEAKHEKLRRCKPAPSRRIVGRGSNWRVGEAYATSRSKENHTIESFIYTREHAQRPASARNQIYSPPDHLILQTKH